MFDVVTLENKHHDTLLLDAILSTQELEVMNEKDSTMGSNHMRTNKQNAYKHGNGKSEASQKQQASIFIFRHGVESSPAQIPRYKVEEHWRTF